MPQRATSRLCLAVALAAGLLLWIALRGPGNGVVDDRPPSEWDARTLAAVDEIRASIDYSIRTSEFSTAREILAQHLRHFPKDPRGPYLMAKLLIAEENLANRADALKYFEQSLKMDPNNPSAWFEAAVVSNQLGQTDQAVEKMRQAHTRAPKNIRTKMYLGRLLLKQGHVEASQKLLREVLALDASRPEAHGILAMTLEKTDPAGAVKHLQKALSLVDVDHEHYDAYLLLKADLHNRLNQPKQARPLLIRIASRRKDEPVVEQLAICYELLGYPLKAALERGGLSDTRPESARCAIRATRAFVDAAIAGKPDLRSAEHYLQRAEHWAATNTQAISHRKHVDALKKRRSTGPPRKTPRS
jgi:tetratricopeptide (TPR) repeat protein